jgi:hypothetical protein
MTDQTPRPLNHPEVFANLVQGAAEEGRIGELANASARQDVFADYHQQCSPNTRRRHRAELALFAQYLQAVGLSRLPEGLYHEADAWRGI